MIDFRGPGAFRRAGNQAGLYGQPGTYRRGLHGYNMKTLVLIASCALVFCILCRDAENAELRIASGGESFYEIVMGDFPLPAEKTAALELSSYLERVTGAEFPVVRESGSKGRSGGIYVGWTNFAEAAGVDFRALGDEEWIIQTSGKNFVLTGGRPRGALYAVYEFLENQAGCRWLAWDAEVVPYNHELAVPRLDLRGSPAFEPREVYTRHHFWQSSEMQERIKAFSIRNRQQWRHCRDTGGWMVLPVGSRHTFYYFVNPEEWFETHPEYFSMNRSGERTAGNWRQSPGAAGSALCLSNPDVARIAAVNISRLIRKKEMEFAERGWPREFRIVHLQQPDNTPFICLCPDCSEISKREGSESGLLVKFANSISELLVPEYPDIKLLLGAYTSTDEPPLNVKPHDNVMVKWVNLYGISDCYRPLTHPVNREQARKLRGWAEITEEIKFREFWNMGSRLSAPGLPIVVPVESVASDMRFIRKHKAVAVFIETERGITQQSFFDLSAWAGMQLMNNPDLQAGELVDTFICGYYGPSAPSMREYYDFLSDAVMNEPGPLFAPVVSGRIGVGFYDMEYLLRCREKLLRAESKAEPDSKEELRVWREMIVVYKSMLTDWEWLKREAGREFPFAREEMLESYERMRRALIQHQFSGRWLSDLEEDLQQEMLVLGTKIPLPEKFSDLPPDRVTAFEWYDLHTYGSGIVEDPGAAGGKADRLTTGIQGIDHNSRPYAMGAYNRTDNLGAPGLRLGCDDIPLDEKYHLYNLGRIRLGRGSTGNQNVVWAHGSWLLSCFIDRAYQLDDGIDPAINDWDVYVSLKFTGPAYVEGSEGENAVYFDRVILVRPEGWEVKQGPGCSSGKPDAPNHP